MEKMVEANKEEIKLFREELEVETVDRVFMDILLMAFTIYLINVHIHSLDDIYR